VSTAKDRKAYSSQRLSAGCRGIDFKLTFEEWYDWWQATGHYHERGRKKGQYCMSRIGDTGAYELGNIFCQLFSKNVSDAQSDRIDSKETIDKRAAHHLGATRSDDAKLNMSKAQAGRTVPNRKSTKLVKCTVCGKEGHSGGLMNKWHFENCSV
jgi:hypothetical protein